MKLIRKYAGLLALASSLLLLAAAPYLIPENPDSPIFRSGMLGLLLALAAVWPVCEAFSRAGRRQLVCGMGFGLLFAVALSLGSELFIYDGLLRGMGSLLRRLAVPVMATPALGGLCARLMLGQIRETERPRRWPVAAFAAVMFVCWLPLLLAFYPGMLNYDFSGQFGQHLDGVYSNIHPLVHSALANGIILLGEALVDRTFGVLMLSVIQMACFALALGYSCAFVQRRGAPVWVTLLMLALYSLHPVFSVMSVSMTKDTLFAAAVLVFSLMSWTLLEDPAAFFAGKARCALYVLMGVGAALLRNNGVFALLLMAPALIAVLRGWRVRVAGLMAAIAVGCAVLMGVLSAALSPESLPGFQLYSLPAQQLVRASQTMTDEERAELREWYTDDMGMRVVPHLGDSAKGYLDRPRIQKEGSDFLKLWLRHMPEHAHEYLEAFLMLNVGSWYPDDLSHSTIYPDASYNDKGYLQLQELDPVALGVETRCFLPGVANLFERICRRNDYQEYPIISQLFCTATPFWAIVLACAMLVARRRSRMLPAALGALGLWLSYLFGPCTLPRYALPLFCLAPVLLALAFLTRRKPAGH